jgi:hypothetical protein
MLVKTKLHEQTTMLLLVQEPLLGYLHTREVLYLGAKNKFCIICNFSKVNGIEPKNHVCWKNYEGSSTGMESTIILEGFKTI